MGKRPSSQFSETPFVFLQALAASLEDCDMELSHHIGNKGALLGE
jgi:hypothetical protein